MNQLLFDKLDLYRIEKKIINKGRLALVLYITRKAKTDGLPLNATALKAKSEGQVAGLSVSAVQSILKDYGITRILAKEGGRTSRGNIENMMEYVNFLNELYHDDLASVTDIEGWWIDRVVEYFSSKPFHLKLASGYSLRSMIIDIIDQAMKKQKDNPGTMYAGALLQHLVGAKLAIILKDNIEHHGFSVADDNCNRAGDFCIGSAIIHVTTSPGDALIDKCIQNINSGMRPLIVTLQNKVAVAIALAEYREVANKIEVIDVEQFLATNIQEWSKFDDTKQKETLAALIAKYNEIVEEHETDQSLRIEF